MAVLFKKNAIALVRGEAALVQQIYPTTNLEDV